MIDKFRLLNKNTVFIFVSLAILSLIPVIYTWGRLPIGGDVFIQINSDALKKYLYQWITVENGQYLSLDFFPFYIFYKIFEFFKLSLYQISSLLLFSLNFIAGMGIYKLIKLFFKKKHFSFYILPIIFYLLSPALLNGWVFGYVYSFAPWFVYFVFKVIKSRRFEVKDMIFMSFLLFFLSVDLPNPKYLFYLIVFSLVTISSAIFFKLIDFKFIANNLVKLMLFLLLSAYLFLPLFHFASNYSPELYDVHIKAGYVDTGQMMDYGSATVVKMVRLHQDNMNIEVSRGIEYNSNLVVGVLSYLPIVLIIIGLFLIKDRYYLIFTFLSICFLFFAVGPNKPFGLLYEFFVSNFKHLAFLRTTAGAVFFLSIFYSVLLAFILDRLAGKSKIIYPLIFLSILIVGYPLLNGDYYKNRSIGNPYADNKQYGQRIPQDYFDIKKEIDATKKDMKIVYSVPNLSYINTTWGYFGFAIYLFTYDSSNLGFKTVFSNLANHNVGLIYIDKSLIDSSGIEAIANEEKSTLLKKTNLIELRKVKDDYFLPHFYVPKNIIYSNGGMEILPEIVGFQNYELRSGIYLENLKIEDPGILDREDEILVKGELENKITEEELGTLLSKEQLPYVSQEPGSLTYPMVLVKEKFAKWKIRKEQKKLFEMHLFYASKRIAEFNKYIGKIDGSAQVMEKYSQEMIAALEILRNLKSGEEKDLIKLWIKYKATLTAHEEKIEEIGEAINWEIVFEELREKIDQLKTKRDFSKLVYKIDVPKEGEYEIFINENGENRSLRKEYLNKGIQKLTLPIEGMSENLIDEGLRIKDYSPDSIYRISFDYKALRGGGFFVAEGKDGEAIKTQLPSTGDEFNYFEMFFKSSSNVQEASVHLSISVNEEKNLKIERIYQPEIILRMKMNRVVEATKKVPEITFVKINPTKYRVKVENATAPYTLVFSENFHKGWKIYIADGRSRNDYGEIVASYFNGEIKEGTHKNIFLDKNVFETWNENQISEDKHLLVNGYANSWYIIPGDTGGEQDYELIIEFLPQRFFYIGLFISGIILVGCLIYLLYISIVKKNRQ